MPRDGCKECSKRRIRCDKTTPQCTKCVRKGIRCSGLGVQFTFVGGIARRGRHQGQSVPAISTSSQNKANASQVSHGSRRRPHCLRHTREIDAFVSHGALSNSESLGMRNPRDAHDYDGVCASIARQAPTTRMNDPQADLIFEPLAPGIRMLFNYFSEHIASIMVPIDRGPNGYRDVLLPLAHHDDLVQRTVSLVAAYHMSSRRPDILPYAVAGKTAIVQRLVTEAATRQQDKIFSLSTWATLLLLLVGGTVTGSDDFVHVYPMLMCLLRHSDVLKHIGRREYQFLLQQTRMFQLFVPPFLDRDLALSTSDHDIEGYLDFLFPEQFAPLAQPDDQVHIFQAAILAAIQLYQKQAKEAFAAESISSDIERLKEMVLPITPANPGMHILPWVYFIAAASSQDHQQRSFFSGRLLEVYHKTRMNNILVAMKRLEQIWLLQPNGEWARDPTFINPVLII